MKLFLIEIKKLLFTKLTIILLIFIVIICFIMPISYVASYRKDNANYQSNTIREIAKKYSEFKERSINIHSVDKLYSEIPYPENIPYNAVLDYLPNYFNITLDAINYRETGLVQSSMSYELVEKSYEVISMNKLKEKLREIQTSGLVSSYDYINYSKQLSMMEKVGKPKFVYKHFWEMYDSFQMIAVFIIAVFMSFIFSMVFSQEYTSKMYMIIASSSLGKKAIVWKKLFACVAIGIFMLIISNILIAICYLVYGGLYGGNALINSLSINYAYSPYTISIWQFFVIRILFQIVSIIALVTIISYCSLRFKSSLISTIIGLIAIFSEFGFTFLTRGNKTFLSYLSLTNGFNTSEIFKRYISFNFFGRPVLYPYVLILYLLCIIAVFTTAIYLYYCGGKCNKVK